MREGVLAADEQQAMQKEVAARLSAAYDAVNARAFELQELSAVQARSSAVCLRTA